MENRKFQTIEDRIAALDCAGEIRGFTEQMERDGRMTVEIRHALARRRVELQRMGK